MKSLLLVTVLMSAAMTGCGSGKKIGSDPLSKSYKEYLKKEELRQLELEKEELKKLTAQQVTCSDLKLGGVYQTMNMENGQRYLVRFKQADKAGSVFSATEVRPKADAKDKNSVESYIPTASQAFYQSFTYFEIFEGSDTCRIETWSAKGETVYRWINYLNEEKDEFGIVENPEQAAHQVHQRFIRVTK